jgi:hypothetical protein
MYCIVCLNNRARDFFCPYCEDNIKQLLREGQLKVTRETYDDFKSLPMNKQWEVIYHVNKRLGKALKADVYKESDFRIDILIREYSEMVLLRHQELEIPQRTENDDINRRSYTQYMTIKGGIL